MTIDDAPAATRTFTPRRPDLLPAPVPYDPELEPGLAGFLDLVEKIPLRAETILVNRAHFDSIMPPLEAMAAGKPVRITEHLTPGPEGAPQVAITIIEPEEPAEPGARRPGFYNIHGGGMVLGNRYFGVAGLIEYVQQFGAVAASVEYRLAPDHPAPAQAEDCYAGLVWFAAQAEELGIDPERIVVMGDSAGADCPRWWR